MSQIYIQTGKLFLTSHALKDARAKVLSAWAVHGHTVKRICFVICKLHFPLHCLWFFVCMFWLRPLVSEGTWWQSGDSWGGSCPSLSPKQTWQKGIFDWGAGWAAGGGMSSSVAWRLSGLSTRALGCCWEGWDNWWPNHGAESPPRAVNPECLEKPSVTELVSQPSVTAQCHSQPSVISWCHIPVSQPSVSVTARQHPGLCKHCHCLVWGAMVQITSKGSPHDAETWVIICMFCIIIFAWFAWPVCINEAPNFMRDVTLPEHGAILLECWQMGLCIQMLQDDSLVFWALSQTMLHSGAPVASTDQQWPRA